MPELARQQKRSPRTTEADGEWHDVPSDDLAVIVEVDSGDSSVTYVCRAAPGSDSSDDVWQIMKVDETSGTVVTWADGDRDFDNVADNRESLNFS